MSYDSIKLRAFNHYFYRNPKYDNYCNPTVYTAHNTQQHCTLYPVKQQWYNPVTQEYFINTRHGTSTR